MHTRLCMLYHPINVTSRGLLMHPHGLHTHLQIQQQQTGGSPGFSEKIQRQSTGKGVRDT